MMFCAKCKEEGSKSSIYVGQSQVTCAMFNSYFDEDGKHHNHNPNCSTTNFSCSRNHHWIERSYMTCWCGWKVGESTLSYYNPETSGQDILNYKDC